MNSFNKRVRQTITNHYLEKVFSTSDASDFKDSQFICITLENENGLRLFLKNYVDKFRNNKLETTDNFSEKLIFLKQLEYMERELKYKYQQAMAFYNKTEFQITDEFETFVNLPDKIRSEMHPMEFILFLIFNKTEYIELKEVYVNSPRSIFGISLRLDFLKPIEELFEELRLESEADDYYGYKFDKGPNGAIKVTH